MKSRIFWNFVTGIAIGIFLFALAAQAESKTERSVSFDQQCADLVRECFGYGKIERVNCFYSAATHPFCEGTELGKLTHKRWSFSPIKLPGNEEPAALLGPQLVDQDCLGKFDNQWFSNLIDNNLSSDALARLSTALFECKRELPDQLPRP